jgi:hypothetical protein
VAIGGKSANEKLTPNFQDLSGIAWAKPGITTMQAHPKVTLSDVWGAHNSAKSAAFPRMHNKFLVFCRAATVDEESYDRFEPYAVWTGSFNLTYNASNSLENAILIRDEKISTAFLNEFGLIFGLSEKLDWSRSWSAPEYRIGS